VHVGGSPAALDILAASDMFDLNEMTGYGTEYFKRDYILPAPHNTFISTAKLDNVWSDFELNNVISNYNINYSFNEQSDKEMEDVKSIYIDYSARSTYDIEYKWNVDFKAWERFRVGELQVDALNDLPIIVDNIVVIKVPSEVVLDEEFRIALDVLGRGDAIFFINGKQVSGFWEKTS